MLEASIKECVQLFDAYPKIVRILQTLADVGLDYLTLGQAAPTLSGGEAQRVKLAAELARPDTGRTLYLLDEPTTGLHFEDIRKLLDVLHRLVDVGNTVVVIEHNLDVIKQADWILDLGPEAGMEGGHLVVAGTPEQVAEYAIKTKKSRGKRGESKKMRSYTGEYLDEVLKAGPVEDRSIYKAEVKIAESLKVIHDQLLEDAYHEAFGADQKRRAAGETNQQMPWTVLGKNWHLMEKMTEPGRRVYSRETVSELIDLLTEIVGASNVDYTSYDRVKFQSDGQLIAELYTRENRWLRLMIHRPSADFDWTLLETAGLHCFRKGATYKHPMNICVVQLEPNHRSLIADTMHYHLDKASRETEAGRRT